MVLLCALFKPITELFNDRVRQHVPGDSLNFFFRRSSIERVVEIQHKKFTLAYVFHALVLHLFECVLDGLALGVEHRPFQCYIDMSLHYARL